MAETTNSIRLSDGSSTVVDAADVEFLTRWRWKRHPQGYASRTAWDSVNRKYVTVLMHRAILRDIPVGMTVDHINRDKLDNRRENLRIVTQGENNRNRPRESWPLQYPDEKTCELCGAAYKPNPRKRKRQKTCSRDCAYALRARSISATKQARKAA